MFAFICAPACALAEEDVDTYESRFKGFIALGIDAETIEDMYKGAMEKIKADPTKKPAKAFSPDKSFKKPGKKSLEERKASVVEKKAAQKAKLLAAMGAGGDDEEEDE